jgi:hypothetical protein
MNQVQRALVHQEAILMPRTGMVKFLYITPSCLLVGVLDLLTLMIYASFREGFFCFLKMGWQGID